MGSLGDVVSVKAPGGLLEWGEEMPFCGILSTGLLPGRQEVLKTSEGTAVLQQRPLLEDSS